MPSLAPHDLLPPEITVLERGWLSANNILFVGHHDTAIVDTGYCSHAGQTVELVRNVLQGRPLDRILNTHLWTVENEPKWLLEDSENYHYNIRTVVDHPNEPT